MPIVCSVCLQPPMAFNPRPEFVDFGSAFDGPVIDDPNAEGNQVYIDKIVVCEHCVKRAAGLLHYGDIEKHVAENETLAQEITNLDKEMSKKDKAIADLAHTVGTLIDHPVKRPAGRPQLRGPETHEEAIKNLRSSRARAEKISKAKKKAGDGADSK